MKTFLGIVLLIIACAIVITGLAALLLEIVTRGWFFCDYDYEEDEK